MKIGGMIGALAVVAGFGCTRAESPKADAAPGMVGPRVVVLKVDGMACEGCASDIKAELTALPGVEGCTVVLKEGRAYVTVSEKEGATVERMVKAIEENPSHKATVVSQGSAVAGK